MNCRNHEANHILSSARTKISWRCLDGVAHLPFGHAVPCHCCGWLAIRQSTTHSPSPPNNPSYPHTISGAPKFVKRNLSTTPMNQIKETKHARRTSLEQPMAEPRAISSVVGACTRHR